MPLISMAFAFIEINSDHRSSVVGLEHLRAERPGDAASLGEMQTTRDPMRLIARGGELLLSRASAALPRRR